MTESDSVKPNKLIAQTFLNLFLILPLYHMTMHKKSSLINDMTMISSLEQTIAQDFDKLFDLLKRNDSLLFKSLERFQVLI